jgi:hypothetical protein
MDPLAATIPHEVHRMDATNTSPDVEAELAKIEARRRPSGRPCPVATFLGVATEAQRLAFDKAVARGWITSTVEHFREVYPDITLNEKGIHTHVHRACRCFR